MEELDVFVIGDSISLHYGPYLEQYLKGRYRYARKKGGEAAMADLDIPAGANGGDSSLVLEYLRGNNVHQEIPQVDYLLINCGLHDIKRNPEVGRKQIGKDRYEENLLNMIQLSATICERLIWISTTPFLDWIHNKSGMLFQRFYGDCLEYNRIASEIMSAYGIPIIDLHNFTLALGEDIYCDHVHFSEDVRQMQAAFIAGWLYHV